MNKKIYISCFYILFCFSGIFCANVTYFSPSYIAYFIFSILFYTYISFNKKITCKNTTYSFIFLLTILLQFYLIGNMFFFGRNEYFKDYCLIIISLSYLDLTLIFTEISSINLIQIAKKFLSFSAIILVIDFFWRFINKSSNYNGIQFFYNFKENGLMYEDSNYSAFFALIVFGFTLYLKNKKIIGNKYIALFFILILLNLSRACILAAICTFFVYIFLRCSRKTKIYIAMIIIPIISCFALIFFNLFSSDYSFITKLRIFNGTINYLKNATFFEMLFGHGLFTSEIYLNVGYSGHNYISNTLVDFGLFALFIYLFIQLFILIITKGQSIYITLPYLIAGLSHAPIVLFYFYALLGFILLYERGIKWGKTT